MLNKIIPTNIHTAPVSHIIINQPIDQKRYDHLFEQWLNPDHNVWQDFVAEHQIQLEQQDELAPTTSTYLESKEMLSIPKLPHGVQ